MDTWTVTRSARKLAEFQDTARPQFDAQLLNFSAERIPRQRGVNVHDVAGRPENEMGKTTLVAFRLENELLKRIDAYAKRLEDETPGLKLARADTVRILLARDLSVVESPEGSRKQRA